MVALQQASLGFETKLWNAADLLRSNLDPAEYKHVVLGLLFLKYISDAFEERRAYLRDSVANPASEYYVKDPKARAEELEILLEDQDEYTAENVFWVPREARWETIQAAAKRPEIGKVVDDAMEAIEKANPRLRGVLPMIYARPALDQQSLGKLIDLFSGIGLGTAARTCWDVCTNTSCLASPVRRAKVAASSTRRRVWSGCWWRCWSPTRAGCSIPAADRGECLYSR
jgi:type I restriction enzyme M protein